MKIQIVGLGSFGMFLAKHFVKSAWQVWGFDIDPTKKTELEKCGGIWGDNSSVDVRLLAIFPSQIKSISEGSSLIVNVSSVQQIGITRLEEFGVSEDILMSFHPLFGPVGVSKSGWLGKQIISTRLPKDPRADQLVKTFTSLGVQVETMSAEEHDQKMASHALAFFVAEVIEVGAIGTDPRYLTGSARHMLGLLEFTEKSSDLRRMILSNPAFKQRWLAIKERIMALEKEFSWLG